MNNIIKLLILLSIFGISNLLAYEENNSTKNKDLKTVFALKNWEPYYITNNKGEPDGFAIEVFEKIAKRINLEYKYVTTKEWHEAFTLIEKDEIDIIPNIGITKERKKLMGFSNPTDTFDISFFKLKSTIDINTIQDLNNKKIAVVEKNAAKKILKKRYSHLQTVVFKSYLEAVRALIEERVDVLCYPENLLYKTLDDLHLRDKVIKFAQPIATIKRAIAIVNKDPILLQKINNELVKMEENGELDQLHKKWFKDVIPPNNTNFFLIISAIIALSLLAFYYLYRKEIATGEKNRILFLFFIFLGVVFFTVAISLYIMYNTAYEEQKNRLIETAKTKARLIESINRFDTQHFVKHGDTVEEAFQASMGQVKDAHSLSSGIGKTGEFTLAKLEGNQIVFILNHKHSDFNHPKPVPLNSSLAEPMRLALAGVSGTIEGQDYRGELVLAAVEPVYTTTRLGLVAKIDIKEIREPFIKTALFATTIAIILVLIGTVGFLKITNPIIRKIQESEKKYKNIIETANEAIFIVDENDSITFANDKAFILLDIDKNDTLIGKDYSEFIPKEHLATYAMRKEDRKQGVSENYETQLLQKNGIPIWVIVSSSTLWDSSHNFSGVLLMISDIDERKKSEEQLISARIEAEKANETKSLFLSNMSHEIRTPLNGIIGLTNLTLNTKLDLEQKNYLEKIETSSKSLLRIINDILDYSKIESGQFYLEKSYFNLNEILENIIGLFRYEIEKKGLNFQVNINNNVPLDLLGDQLRLSQVLINFIGNALKFTSKGEIVVTISLKSKENKMCELLFSIKDTGIGIKKEDQKKLFSKFTQVDDSYKRKYEGTGLGLAISKEFVKLMGGDVCLESTYGEGSNFYFTIKVQIATETDKSTQQEVVTNNSDQLRALWGEDVLLVEDNNVNQTVAKAYLENMHLNVTLANNGLEALEQVKEKDFAVIFMDLQMPIMDGIEATKEIKKIKGKEDIPIIALTASVLEEDKLKTQDAGMVSHLHKPIDASALQKSLLKYIKPRKKEKTLQIVKKKEQISTSTNWDNFKYINTKKLLENLQFDEDLIINLLSTFASKYSNTDHILNPEQIGNEEFNKFIHSLKGESGNLCIDNLYILSKKINEADENEDVLEDTIELNKLLHNVVIEINTLLNTHSNPTERSLPLNEMLDNIESFINKLENNYIISIEESNNLLDQLKTYTSQTNIQIINDALESLEYNNARTVLKNIYNKLQTKDE